MVGAALPLRATLEAAATRAAQPGSANAAPSTGASDALAALTLEEASARIKAGTVSSVDLVQACLARIEIYNPKINAFITVTRDAALAQAKALDAERSAGKLRGPLHGIPIALKDNIDTAGVRTTGASRLFEQRVPDADAEVARRLKQAGAILLGKLNLHEFAYGGSSTVTAFGTMQNPWRRGHVTEPLTEGLAAGIYGHIYACGPMGLLKRLAAVAAEYGVAGEAALETPMGCGFGACLGCAVPHQDGHYALCCKDGPVFRFDEVVW